MARFEISKKHLRECIRSRAENINNWNDCAWWKKTKKDTKWKERCCKNLEGEKIKMESELAELERLEKGE